MWTKEQLKTTVKKKLGDRLLVIASNREPYIHTLKEKKVEVIRPVGGAVTALDPIMMSCGGVWVAHGSGMADRKVVDENGRVKVPPEQPKYTLRRIWLSKEEEDGYYYGFSNRALWPLCHVVYALPTFDASDWSHYRKVNQKFAQAILEEIGEQKAFVWIQDYHLALVAKFIKEANPKVTCIHFWHIPWPNPEAFRICPTKREILEGLLANDIMGFHIRYQGENFLNTVELELEARIDRERTSVIYGGHETLVRAFPISVDFESLSEGAASGEVDKKMTQLKEEFSLDYDFILFGMDRIDYTKGIPEKLRAVRRLLEKYPEYTGRIVFIQMGALSRVHIKRYKELNDEINELVEEINWKYSTDAWSPIIFIRRDLSLIEKLAFFRLADVCVVSPLHDGMNLVSKEYISAKIDLDGVLVLSQFTGSARELGDVVSVNPYDTEDFTDKLREALEMSREEKSRRMKRLREIVKENNIYKWAGKSIEELEKIRIKRRRR